MATNNIINNASPNIAAHSVVISEGASDQVGVLLGAGEVLIGTTASDPAHATLTAGTGISITSISGSITIDATGGSVNPGTINDLAYYAATGSAVSALPTANNGTLVTSNTGVPSILAGPGVSGKVLQSNAAAAPSYSIPTYPSASGTAGNLIRSNGTNNLYTTLTFPDTIAQNAILYGNVANNLGPITSTNSAAFVTTSAGVPGWTASMTNGQLVIGSTGATPTPGTLTAGTGISISNGAGSITISSTGSGMAVVEVTGTSQAMASNTTYIANNVGLVTFTLPSTFSVGDAISVVGKGAGGWIIAQNAGQNQQVGSVSSTVGAGGSVASTNRFDSINYLATTANTTVTTFGGPQSAGLTIV